MKTIRRGMIGCGNVTEVKSGPAFQKADGSELVAVMRRNGELAREYARPHGVPLFVAQCRRALPRFLHVKSWIDEGRIGKPLAVTLRVFQKPSRRDVEEVKHWRVERAISGGGYFVDLGSHMIDLVQFLLGPIASAGGFAANQLKRYEVEDAVGATFRFECGALGTGLWTFNTAENLDAVEIVGSKGRIRCATFENRPVTLEADGTAESRSIPHPEHIQQPLIQSIVNELLGNGTSPSTG